MKTVSPLLKREMNDKRHFELLSRRKVVIVCRQNCLSTELFVVKIVCHQYCLSTELFVVKTVCRQRCLLPSVFAARVFCRQKKFSSQVFVERVFCRQYRDHLPHLINTNSESCWQNFILHCSVVSEFACIFGNTIYLTNFFFYLCCLTLMLLSGTVWRNRLLMIFLNTQKYADSSRLSVGMLRIRDVCH